MKRFQRGGRLTQLCRIGFAALALALFGMPARAQNTTSYVSYNGNDTNPCTHSSPCYSLDTALLKTNAFGTIRCLDADLRAPDVFNFKITKSLTIDCSDHPQQIVGFTGVPTTDALTISAGASDIVTIRGIRIANPQGNGSNTRAGIAINSAKAVYLDDVVVDGQGSHGVFDFRTGGGTKLFIRNSVFQNNGGVGILAAAGATSGVVLTNVQSLNNNYGLAVASGNNVTVDHSVFSGNNNGVEADSGAQIAVNDSTISHTNGPAVVAGGRVRLSNNEINFNNQAFSGTPLSFGNNRLTGNVTLGATPTPAGTASSDQGQQ